VPASLLQAAWSLMREAGFTAPEAVAVVSLNPALSCGLLDRGQIAPGRRGDLVRVRELNGVPVVREVWRGSRRVA
jgi:alpha-D-ribose 1-methylphosphonate 5-triphosphate diphosphatase